MKNKERDEEDADVIAQRVETQLRLELDNADHDLGTYLCWFG